MISPAYDFLILIGGLVAYIFVHNRLMAFVQPIRMECARLGKALLDDEQVTEKARRHLTVMLQDAYNPWFAPFLVVAIPCCLVLLAFKSGTAIVNYGIQDKAVVARIESVGGRLMLCHVLSSPILLPVIVGELLVAILLLAVVGANYQVLKTMIVSAERLKFHKKIAAA